MNPLRRRALLGPLPTLAYYLDPNGSDLNNGRSDASPWQTIAAVNGATFPPGAKKVLLKRGGAWREALTVPASGSPGRRFKFDAYGSGSNPQLNGSAPLTNASFSPSTVTGATLVNVTPTVSNDDGATRNYRQTFTASFSSSTVQIKLTAAAGGNWVIVGTAIGQQTNGNAVSSMTRITWAAANGVTIAANGTATSDAITFSVVKGNTYLVHIYMTARHLKQANATGPSLYSDSTAVDETLVTSPTGSQLNTISTNVQVLTQVIASDQTLYTITPPSYALASLTASGTTATATTSVNHNLQTGQLITVSGATPAGYNVSAQVTVVDTKTFTYTVGAGLSSPATGTPVYMIPVYETFENQVYLLKQTSSAACVAWGSWFWDSAGNVLWVNPSDNSDARSNGKTYEVSWQTYSIYDNKQSYLEIANIDCLQTYGSGDASGNINTNKISGIFLSGTNNIVRDLKTYNHSRHCFSFYVSAINCEGYNLTIGNGESTTNVVFFGNSGVQPSTQACTLRNSVGYNDNARCVNDGLVRFHGGASGCILQDNELYVTLAAKNTTEHVDMFDSGTSKNTIRRNYFHGYMTAGVLVGIGSAGTGMDGNAIYNNLFDWTQGLGNAVQVGAHVTNLALHNNTFYNPTATTYFLKTSTATGSSITANNNILYSANAINIDAGSTGVLNSDFNDHYFPTTITWIYGGTTYTTFANWKTNSGQDAHSINSDPLFTNAGAGQYWPQGGSPVIGAGTNLGSTYQEALAASAAWPTSVTTAIQPASWDVGAFAV